MIPILFDKTATTFTSNGIGRLTDCISCKVTEERNGIYELELEYPITGQWYDEMMANGGIIGVIHDDNHDIQPFDIYMSTSPIDGVVTFYAHHISYRLNNIMLQPFTATSASDAISKISTNSVNTNPFSFSTDKTTVATFDLKKPASVRSILFGSEGSLLDTFGTAEFEFDKFDVKMLLHRGTDTGVTVRYGKNMTDLERTKDDSGTYNAIAPFWSDGVNYVYPDSIIVQPTTPITPLKPITMDFSDKFEQQPTKAELETAARNFLDANEPWIISDNIKINFIALWQTDEYADVASIQRVGLCDTVSVYYTDMGLVAEKKKVVRVVFDVLAERFEELELGTVSNAYVAITDGTEQVSNVPVDQALNGKVSKTGDTMTGALIIQRAAGVTDLDLQCTDDDKTVTPIGTVNASSLSFRDKNNSAYFNIRARHTAAGNYGMWLYALNTLGQTNSLHLYIKEDGSKYTQMEGNVIFLRDTSIAENLPVFLNLRPHQTDNDLTYNNAGILVYDDHDASNSGTNMVIRSGGNMIVGSGESPSNIYTELVNGKSLDQSEFLMLCSDQTIRFFTNCNTIANRVETTIDTSGNFSGKAANVTGTVAIANGGTGANSASGALSALNGLAQVVASAGNTATTSYNTVITFNTSMRCVVVVTSSTVNSRALFLVWCTGAGAVTVTEIYKGSNITYETGTSTLTIKTSGGTVYSDVLMLNTKDISNVTLSRVAKT